MLRLALLLVLPLLGAGCDVGARPADDVVRSELAALGLGEASVVGRYPVGGDWTVVLASASGVNAALLFDPDDQLRSSTTSRSDRAEGFSGVLLLGGLNPLGERVPRVVAGVVQDPRIVRVAVRVDDGWQTWEVAEPGFAYALPEEHADAPIREWVLEDAAGDPVVGTLVDAA